MARKARVEYQGAVYHVLDRGDRREAIFLDDWEQAHGLNASDDGGDNGPWGDPDGDGLTNFREFQAGTDPSKANPIHGVSGYAQWEYWDNIRSSSRRQTGLEALKSNAAFPLKPTERDWVIRLEGLPEFGEFYGSRLRAYVIPPVTGEYRLSCCEQRRTEMQRIFGPAFG